ncbi:3-deoxy-8-phosphooctulonate synthase [Candidatus Methylacidithermus pantelleriae]|uniref:2-dehydro-3-deoxyphosphooctonate aldolase n=1 Tax=Candidatus Methylacidithermus pantelleriae TaxID=2744239 RepID=A0A8J2FRU0_9BACT|nr:3-deoxy-8-phosphooctulonate synthase [Candidatus Methylacidithermus pantelleriae]CAF0693994.1 2-dehydro-3-deoxyphosphooctonate aldolase [Candidatus Methylacidithermus pantelleriae]
MKDRTQKNPLVLIAGPCLLESLSLGLEVAEFLKEEAVCRGFQFVFKASFDKANRSCISSPRGPGLAKGLEMLAEIRNRVGVAVTTDVHECWQVREVASVADLIQIPAFLSRQTELLLTAARSGRPVNVKKGQFLAPEDADRIAEKLRAGGCGNYFITERGTSFGYRDLVVDMRSLALMRRAGHRVIFDATHSVQRPGSLGNSSGGDRSLVPVLARAAVAAGVDGLFMETHPDPDRAWSDGPCMLPLKEIPSLLDTLGAIYEAIVLG